MSFTAIIPVARLATANSALETQGFGPGNFSTQLNGAANAPNAPATHMALHHLGDDPAFEAACQALPQCVVVPAAQLRVEFGLATAGRNLKLRVPDAPI
jgi:hypothetical protein